MTKKKEYVVWAGMKQREVDPFDRGVLFMRGFPVPVDEGDAKELKKNPNFVFITPDQATELKQALMSAPDRPAQRVVAHEFAEGLQGEVARQKEAYVTARNNLRKEQADLVKALKEDHDKKPFLVLGPGDALPEGSKDLGGGYAVPPETEPEKKPAKKKPATTATTPPPPKAGDKGGAEK